MNKAKYTGYETHKFPLRTEGMQFVEDQMQLAAQIARIADGGAGKYILKAYGGADEPGVVIIDGEIYPSYVNSGIQAHLSATPEDILAGGNTYTAARTRIALYPGAGDDNPNRTGQPYNWYLRPIPSNRALRAALDSIEATLAIDPPWTEAAIVGIKYCTVDARIKQYDNADILALDIHIIIGGENSGIFFPTISAGDWETFLNGRTFSGGGKALKFYYSGAFNPNLCIVPDVSNATEVGLPPGFGANLSFRYIRIRN
jgi:hypothetical protein